MPFVLDKQAKEEAKKQAQLEVQKQIQSFYEKSDSDEYTSSKKKSKDISTMKKVIGDASITPAKSKVVLIILIHLLIIGKQVTNSIASIQ